MSQASMFLVIIMTFFVTNLISMYLQTNEAIYGQFV